MKLYEILYTIIHERLDMQQVLNENSDRYILLPYDDEYNEDFEEYGIDEYDAADAALEIAKSGGVTILSDKRLSGILLDTKVSKVIGAIWVSDSSDTFSFDIAIDTSYQNMSLSNILIKAAIDEYQSQKYVYDDMGEDFRMEVDVISPKLAQILKSKYGFYVVAELSPHRVLMSMD